MIRLKSGRLLLVCDRADRTWHARITLGPKPEQQLDVDTGTIQLQAASLRAEKVFQRALAWKWSELYRHMPPTQLR